ncbi:putative RNA methyltransferase [Kineococcus auxinigenes]|uniref:putative RNA methyltransferase n=1 Tax=unclassified Kineococcus TaxID=2621656 RepID=UPI003D7D23AA
MLAALPALRCPVCGQPLAAHARRLVCPAGHSADVARQGYVNLTGGGRAHPGDTAGMVAARERFLAAGHYAPVAAELARLAAELAPGAGRVVDVGGGTGYHLAHVLDALTGADGVCLDTSAPALRRAARAHPRAAAVGADVWRPLPLADGCADLVTTVFAPRGTAEVTRVLRPGGTWVVLTPLPAHLGEVRAVLGMLGLDERKDERLAVELAGLVPAAVRELSVLRPLGREALRDLVLMGPSAHHVDEAGLDERLAALPEVVDVTVAVRLTAVTRPA